MVCLARFELATSVSQIRRSTKLSYRQKMNKDLVAEARIELAQTRLWAGCGYQSALSQLGRLEGIEPSCRNSQFRALPLRHSLNQKHNRKLRSWFKQCAWIADVLIAGRVLTAKLYAPITLFDRWEARRNPWLLLCSGMTRLSPLEISYTHLWSIAGFEPTFRPLISTPTRFW